MPGGLPLIPRITTFSAHVAWLIWPSCGWGVLEAVLEAPHEGGVRACSCGADHWARCSGSGDRGCTLACLEQGGTLAAALQQQAGRPPQEGPLAIPLRLGRRVLLEGAELAAWREAQAAQVDSAQNGAHGMSAAEQPTRCMSSLTGCLDLHRVMTLARTCLPVQTHLACSSDRCPCGCFPELTAMLIQAGRGQLGKKLQGYPCGSCSS